MSAPIKIFQPYSHIERADRAASHRLGHRQKQQVGESFWFCEEIPNIAFKTRKAALAAIAQTKTQPEVAA